MLKAINVKLFEFENSQLAFRRFGNGPEILLAFHGFGQTSAVFMPLEKSLGERYTILAIDLFFHGQSRYNSVEQLTPIRWQRLMNALLQAQHIQQFSLMGFSLGGRFALTTAEAFPGRVDSLILIAPDGITHSNWYWLATSSTVGRWLFRYFLKHLAMLNTVGHAFTQLGLLNRTVMRFAELSLGTEQQRELVYQSWTQFRQIYPDLNLLGRQLTESVNVQFFIGAFDRIIPGYFILPLTKRLRHYRLTILHTGHNRLIELAGEQLSR